MRIVVPNAFKQLNPFFGNTAVPSWFERLADRPFFRTQEIFAAAANASAVLDTVCTVLGRSLAKAAVAGESQGADLFLSLALQHETVAVASLVGLVPAMEVYTRELISRKFRADIRKLNAVEDEIVPIALGRQTATFLCSFDFPVGYTEFPEIGHDLGDRREEIFGKALRFLEGKMPDIPRSDGSEWLVYESVKPVVW